MEPYRLAASIVMRSKTIGHWAARWRIKCFSTPPGSPPAYSVARIIHTARVQGLVLADVPLALATAHRLPSHSRM